MKHENCQKKSTASVFQVFLRRRGENKKPLESAVFKNFRQIQGVLFKPEKGVEPSTYALRMRILSGKYALF